MKANFLEQRLSAALQQISLAALKAKPKGLEPTAYVVFGGTFDPIHQGHLLAVRRLLELFSTVILAPTTENPWKNDKPTSLDLRLQMIELALRAENFTLAKDCNENGVFTLQSGYLYAEEVVKALRKTRSGSLYWAVGEDLAAEVKDWRNWDTLNVTSVVLPIEPQIHAADIRAGRAQVLPALADFVQKHQLYR